jgi:hypothetical protein
VKSVELKLEEPIALMETFYPDLFIVQDNRKRLYLCTSGGVIVHEGLEAKARVECGLKNVSAFCGNLLRPRVFLAESGSGGTSTSAAFSATIVELDLNWLCDNRLASLLQQHNLQATQPPRSVSSDEDAAFTFKKYTFPSQVHLSNSLTSLMSASSVSSTATVQSSGGSGPRPAGSSYTALWHDVHTNKLLAAKTDKQKTVIEIFDSATFLYDYSIESNSSLASPSSSGSIGPQQTMTTGSEKPLKKVTSLCATADGRLVCVDLVQNCAKMFRFV